MEIWNLVFIQDQVDARPAARSAPLPGEEHRHRLVARARRDGAPGRGQRASRPTCSVPLLEVAESLSGRTHGDDARDDVSLKVDRRARPGDDVPDRGRRPAVERGPRVHPAAHAAPRGRARAAARHRADRCWTRSSTGGRACSATPTRSSGENEAFMRAGGGARRRSASRRRCGRAWCCSSEAKGRSADGVVSGRRRVQALGHVRVPDPAHRGAGRRGRAHGRRRIGSPSSCEEQRARARATPRRRSPIGAGRRARLPDRVRRLRARSTPTPDRRVARRRDPRAAGGRGGRGGPGLPRRTPFYAEGGGQVGDQGLIRTPDRA